MEGVLIGVISAACTALFTGGIQLLWKRAEKKMDKMDDKKAEQEARLDKLQEVITGDLELLKGAIQLILRDSLWKEIKFHLQEGYCSQENKVKIREKYTIYHSLGKNGIMDSDVNKVYDLPITPRRGGNQHFKESEEEKEA